MPSYSKILSDKKAQYRELYGRYPAPSLSGTTTPQLPWPVWIQERDWWRGQISRGLARVDDVMTSLGHQLQPAATKLYAIEELLAAEYVVQSATLPSPSRAAAWWDQLATVALRLSAVIAAPSKWDAFVDSGAEAVAELPGRIGGAVAWSGDVVGRGISGVGRGIGEGLGAATAGAAEGFLKGIGGFLVAGGIIAIAVVGGVYVSRRAHRGHAKKS